MSDRITRKFGRNVYKWGGLFPSKKSAEEMAKVHVEMGWKYYKIVKRPKRRDYYLYVRKTKPRGKRKRKK